jgi:hypothetical protein
MNKSFQESGGTVLSTNWSEVGKEKVSSSDLLKPFKRQCFGSGSWIRSDWHHFAGSGPVSIIHFSQNYINNDPDDKDRPTQTGIAVDKRKLVDNLRWAPGSRPGTASKC